MNDLAHALGNIQEIPLSLFAEKYPEVYGNMSEIQGEYWYTKNKVVSCLGFKFIDPDTQEVIIWVSQDVMNIITPKNNIIGIK